MKSRHPFIHWLAVTAVALAALFSLSVAWGQATGSGAVFEGRPAMAGAQAGQGAMAGPPQGGLGVQGDEAQRNLLTLRKPAGLDAQPALPRDPGVGAPAGDTPGDKDKAMPVPKRDPGVAKENRSTVKKARRAGKRTLERARHGTSGIDSAAASPAR